MKLGQAVGSLLIKKFVLKIFIALCKREFMFPFLLFNELDRTDILNFYHTACFCVVVVGFSFFLMDICLSFHTFSLFPPTQSVKVFCLKSFSTVIIQKGTEFHLHYRNVNSTTGRAKKTDVMSKLQNFTRCIFI